MTGQPMISFDEQGRSDREGVGVTDDVANSFEIPAAMAARNESRMTHMRKVPARTLGTDQTGSRLVPVSRTLPQVG